MILTIASASENGEDSNSALLPMPSPVTEENYLAHYTAGDARRRGDGISGRPMNHYREAIRIKAVLCAGAQFSGSSV
ncbi:MAG: hypothetical protein MZV49_25740 [Rhodopseudomonas palustris]|nr:hypothetical protein [Rhodopseudomonas palustris]